MTTNRPTRRRPTVNRYVAAALAIAILGVTIGALIATHVVLTGHPNAMDGWGTAGTAALILAGLTAAALAALTLPRRS